MPTTVSGIYYTFDTTLQAGADLSHQYLLTKMLIGSSSIQYRGSRVRQNVNYSVLPQSIQTKRGREAFTDFLNNFSVGFNEREFIKKTIVLNRKFYQDVLIEFSHYFIQTHRKCHTVAFIHLYRLLERMAFSAPLLYCKASTDYYGTFDDLKTLFNGIDKAGELGFLKKFLNQGKLIDAVLLDSTYRLDFSAHVDKIQHWKSLSEHFNDFVTKDKATHQFEVKFREMIGLTTTIRNRFFHLRTGDGQKNISIQSLGDPNDFFSEVNKAVSSFIAMIALHCASKL